MNLKAKDIADRLAGVADSVAPMLLPHGKRSGAEWCVGSIAGEAGESLKVRMTGSKAGVWQDFASGGKGGDLIDLWAQARGLTLGEAIKQAKEYLCLQDTQLQNPRKNYVKPSCEGVQELLPQHAQWLLEVRRITPETCERYKLASKKGALMFPSLRGGELIAAKYRKIPAKEFFVDADCEPCLFGWQALKGTERAIVICEGELDCLAFAEYRVPALSVPFGGGSGAKQTQWIEAEFDRLVQFDWIFLALDNDAAGKAGTDEIIKRLGRERCRVVTLPRKDANACLIDGIDRSEIVAALTDAKTQDPEQLKQASDFAADLEKEFEANPDGEEGIRLPWKKVGDDLILRMGEVSVWAGYNGHGKSQVIGQISMYALLNGWLGCVASMEFKPVKWLKRLVRQAAGRSDASPAYAGFVARWFHDKLWVFDVSGKAKSSNILDVFAYAARRYGVQFFVIDNLAKCGFDEDDYNAQKAFVDCLTDFVREYQVHVALVCHMRKGENEDKPSDKMGVKGTGAITDMVDTFVSVWRNKPKEKSIKIATQAGQPIPDELKQAPDCILQCGKQRNGESEPHIALWFNQDSLQYLASPHYTPRMMLDRPYESVNENR